MPFDPDKYLEEKSTSKAFDPDAYLAEKAPPRSSSEVELPDRTPEWQKKIQQSNDPWYSKLGQSLVGSVKNDPLFDPAAWEERKKLLKTAANTLTGGYLPQIYGAGKAAIESTAARGSSTPISERYLKNRDAMIDDLENTSGPTKVAGTIMGVVPQLMMGPIGGAKTLLGKMGTGAAVAGGTAFLANPGDKKGEIDPIQFQDRWNNAQVPAMLGAGAPLASKAVPWAISKLQDPTIAKNVTRAAGMIMGGSHGHNAMETMAGGMMGDFASPYVQKGANAVARVLSNPKAPEMISQSGQMGARAMTAVKAGLPRPDRTPEVLARTQGSKFEEPLKAAAERGDDSFGTTYFMMHQNYPEFRELVDDSSGE